MLAFATHLQKKLERRLRYPINLGSLWVSILLVSSGNPLVLPTWNTISFDETWWWAMTFKQAIVTWNERWGGWCREIKEILISFFFLLKPYPNSSLLMTHFWELNKESKFTLPLVNFASVYSRQSILHWRSLKFSWF